MTPKDLVGTVTGRHNGEMTVKTVGGGELIVPSNPNLNTGDSCQLVWIVSNHGQGYQAVKIRS